MLRRGRNRLVALAAVAIVACTDGSSVPNSTLVETADETPSIVGVITAIEAGRVRVEEDPAKTYGSDKALVRLLSSTRISGPDGRPWPADSLRVGRRVRVWFTGPVAESYPVQTAAGRIVIE